MLCRDIAFDAVQAQNRAVVKAGRNISFSVIRLPFDYYLFGTDENVAPDAFDKALAVKIPEKTTARN